MSKIVFVSLNARYTHSTPAVYYLRESIKETAFSSQILSLTINQNIFEILETISETKPDIIAISVYIWNSEVVQKILPELKKILPKTQIILGGPEVSYNSQTWISKFPSVDLIISGNGEIPLKNFLLGKLKPLHKIIKSTENNFNNTPFPYIKEDRKVLENKYLYYEASRGCPFKCSYCLSSRTDQKLQHKIFQTIKKELDFLLSFQPLIIKFIDRTFNADRVLAKKIWEYLKDKNAKFHFEIHPGLLNETDFELLETIPQGKFQFEIGIQSTNPKTLTEVNRVSNTDLIRKNVLKLKKMNNIHIHVDQIVGLPFEDYESFRNSFDDIYKLNADKFQLGFLKVLHGTELEEKSKEYDLKYFESAPYEIISNKWISFKEITYIKKLEELLENYKNSNKYELSLQYILDFFSRPIVFWESLLDYFIENKQDIKIKKWDKLTQILLDFLKTRNDFTPELILDYLRLDWIIMKKNIFFPTSISNRLDKKLAFLNKNKRKILSEINIEFDKNKLDKILLFYSPNLEIPKISNLEIINLPENILE